MNFFEFTFRSFWTFSGVLIVLVLVSNALLMLAQQLSELLGEIHQQLMDHLFPLEK